MLLSAFRECDNMYTDLYLYTPYICAYLKILADEYILSLLILFTDFRSRLDKDIPSPGHKPPLAQGTAAFCAATISVPSLTRSCKMLTLKPGNRLPHDLSSSVSITSAFSRSTRTMLSFCLGSAC